MANPCIISYEGKDYTYEEWMAALHDGLLDTFVKEGVVSLKREAPKGEIPPSKSQVEGESSNRKKKKLLNRAYEGTTTNEIKEAIAKHGLTYETESWATADELALAFIEDVGLLNALEAVRKGMVTGAPAAKIWSEAIDSVGEDLANAKDPDEIKKLEQIEADLLEEFNTQAKKGGQFISKLQDIYKNSDFGYKASTQISKYKDNNGGQIPADVEAKFREWEKELQEVNKKLADAEERAAKLEAEKDIANISESIAREKKQEGSIKEQTKRIADKIRKGKTSRPSMFLSSNPAALAWDGALEIAATTIETGGVIADAIQNAVKHIKETDWYKGLDKYKKQKAEEELTDYLNDKAKVNTEVSIVDGKIKIPHDLIRQKVAEGITDPNELTKSIYNEIVKDYPDVTERQVRDAISNYGKTVNLNQEEIEVKIRKIKRIDRIISALEDIKQKQQRPLRSGQQRDKLDAEERAELKKLKEAMKELPQDAEANAKQMKTSLDAVKARLQNQIEDIEREIETGKKTAKARAIPYDEEAKALLAERDAIKSVRDEIFGDKELTDEQKIDRAIKAAERAIDETERRIAENDIEIKRAKSVTSPELEAVRARLAQTKSVLQQMQIDAGIPEKRRLENAKKTAQRQIAKLQQRLKDKDFSKKKSTPIIEDSELTRLRAEKLRIQDQFDKEQYQNELKNRSKGEKIVDGLYEAWNLTRALRATSEFSFIALQGGINLASHPINSAKAFVNAMSHFASEKRSDEFLRHIQAQEFYPRLKASKLALTEHDAKLGAREELFIGGWVNHIWDILGLPIKPFSKKGYEIWKRLSLPKAFERASIGYMNTLRVQRYVQGEQMLNMQGKTFKDSPQDYKDMADVINTFTGRGSLGKAELISKPLSAIFFSPRMWAATLKQTTPYAFYWLGKKHSKGDPWYKPSVAQKMAVGDYMKFVALTAGILALVRAMQDDEDEWQIGTDPTDSKYMKLYKGNTVVDPWGSRSQMVVLQARLFTDVITKKGKDGLSKDVRLGETSYVDTKGDLLIKMAQSKLAPSASMVNKFLFSHVDKNGVRVDKYGVPIGSPLSMTTDNLYPIYWETIKEVNKEQPSTVAAFLDAMAFFGIGVNVYEKSKKPNTAPQEQQ